MTFEHFIAKRAQVLDDMNAMSATIEHAAQIVVNCLNSGGRLLACGNGGSAAQAMHFASEFVGRFKQDREPLSAFCLNSDGVLMSSIANDYGYERVFSRQILAMATPRDLVCCFSTSGDSPNVVDALKIAREMSVPTLAILGRDGGDAKHFADLSLVVPSNDSAVIQEMHLLMLHFMCEFVEKHLRSSPVMVSAG